MNQEEVFRRLAATLSPFHLHQSFISDFLRLLPKSGVERAVLSLLVTRLKYLLAQGVDAIKHEEFERLSYTETGLYSMHRSGKGFNYRILYAFLSDGSPVLLLVFSERAGKRATSYEKYIPVAEARLRSFEEEYNEKE